MERRNKRKPRTGNGTTEAYDLTTPLWNKYYREVRKRIRFPRYYKKQLNW